MKCPSLQSCKLSRPTNQSGEGTIFVIADTCVDEDGDGGDDRIMMTMVEVVIIMMMMMVVVFTEACLSYHYIILKHVSQVTKRHQKYNSDTLMTVRAISP